MVIPGPLLSQHSLPGISSAGEPEIRTIIPGEGEHLDDLLPLFQPDVLQTHVDPGVAPEGDYMFNSSFTHDGQRILLANGGTDNVTVFDWATRTAITQIEVGDYPCDVAVTDQYAVIPCIFGNEVYVIDLSDYSVAGVFQTGEQPAVAEVSSDGHFAYVSCDIDDVCEVIDLVAMTHTLTIQNFPISLLTFSWISTGGRNSFQFSRFCVTPDGNHLVVGDGVDAVKFFNTANGNVDFNIPGIPSCWVVNLSGNGNTVAAISKVSNQVAVYRIDLASHTITGSVTVGGYSLSYYDIGVNADGSKAYIGISNNSSALVRFNTSDYKIFTQAYTPFWIGTSPDHQYVIHGQNRFTVVDFVSEQMLGQYWGISQSFGCVSPVAFDVIGYDPLRYEGLYFYDCNNVNSVQYLGNELSGLPPEGDTPYRIAVSPNGSKAVISCSLSESVSIIDLQDYSVDTIIDLGEKCDAVGITHDSHWAVMGGYDLNTIKIIDLTTNEFVASIVTGQRPMMVAISPDDQYAYIGNLKGNSVSIVKLEGAASYEVAEIPTGVIGLVWAAYGVRSSVEVDPTGQYVLVAASFDDVVQVIDVSTHQIVATLPAGDFPLKIAFNATGEYAAVTNYFSNNFTLIHVAGASSSVVGTFSSGGTKPLRLAYNSADDEFGILNYDSKTLARVNPQTGSILGMVSLSTYGNPIQILYDQLGKYIVLTLGDSNTPGFLVHDGMAVSLPASPTYFDYCPAEQTAAVSIPGPDNVSVIEYGLWPHANFSAGTTWVQTGGSVDFTDISGNNPTQWHWEFEGGTPPVSIAQNPAVVYNTAGTFDVKLVVSNAYGSDSIIRQDYITVEQAGISLDIKLFLEGPFNGSEMDAFLNIFGYMPLNQPYNTDPWNYAGTESVMTIPSPDVVDWILMELRETPGDVSTATSQTMIARKAAFLMKDGSIRGLDGSSLVGFNLQITQNLFIVLWHRNHLGVISSAPLTAAAGIYSYDFSIAADQAYGGVLAHKEIAPGIWGETGGDADASGLVGTQDKVDMWMPQAGSSGYLSADWNMNGMVDHVDKVGVWSVNAGSGCQVPY